MQSMSVTRALATLKQIDDKIQRVIQEGTFVYVTIGKNTSQKLYDNTGTIDQTKSKIQESFDKVADLMTTRAKIKAAIVKSNAVTLVKILGTEVTVAEAIEMKATVNMKRSLLSTMKMQYTKCNNLVNQLNTKLDETIELNLKTIYGSDKGKVDPSVYESIAKPQREQKEANLLDPMNISKKIESLEEQISAIDTELDFALSEVNAKTEITV